MAMNPSIITCSGQANSRLTLLTLNEMIELRVDDKLNQIPPLLQRLCVIITFIWGRLIQYFIHQMFIWCIVLYCIGIYHITHTQPSRMLFILLESLGGPNKNNVEFGVPSTRQWKSYTNHNNTTTNTPRQEGQKSHVLYASSVPHQKETWVPSNIYLTKSWFWPSHGGVDPEKLWWTWASKLPQPLASILHIKTSPLFIAPPHKPGNAGVPTVFWKTT